MTRARLCRVCRVEAQGAQLPVLMRVHVVEQWHLCGRCWALLQIGVPLMRPESRLEHFVDRGGLLLSASDVWETIQLAIRNAFPTRGRMAGKPIASGEQAWPGLTEPPTY